MPTTNATDQQVNDASTNIETVAKDTSSTSTKMLDEVNKQLTANGMKGNDDASKSVTQKLEQDKILPKLIVAAFDSDQALKEFGDGNKFDIHKLEDAANGKSEHDSPSERMLAQALLDRLKAIDSVGNGDGSVTKVELEQWAQKEQARPSTLNQATLDKAAEELHEAIYQKTIFQTNDPDKNKIASILEPLSAADRAALEVAYHDKYDKNGSADTLRNQLKDKLGGDNAVDWRTTEAVLNRADGRTNDAGALMVALTTMNSDKDKGNALLRNVLITLNAKELQDLDKDFKEKYGKSYLEAIQSANNLNQETKEALPLLNKPVEARTADDIVSLAQIAVKYRDQKMFGDSVLGDSKEAQSARAKLQNDQEFLKNFQNAFPSDIAYDSRVGKLTFEQSVDPIALDYLREGRVSLATIAINNTNRWIFDNKENLKLAVEHATPKEQADFAAGKALAEKGSKPADLNDQDRAQLDYYNRIHSAFKNGGNSREVAIWEDILEHGKETVIGQMAESHDDGKIFGILSYTDKEKLFSAVEKMSEEDWNRLTGNKPFNSKDATNFRAEIEKSLDTYASAEEKKRVLELIDAKKDSKTYEESKGKKRSITDIIDDNTGTGFLRLGTTYDHKTIINQIINMSQQEAENYKNKPEYQKQVNDFVQAHLTESEQLLMRSVLAEVADKGAPVKQLKPVDQILFDQINEASDSDKLKHLEAVLKDPALREQLSKPDNQLTEDQQKINRVIRSAANESYFKAHPTEAGTTPDNNPNLKEYQDKLFSTGTLPVAMRAELNLPKSELITEIANASEADRALLRDKLNPQEQQILEAVLSNPDHKLSTADRMRLFIIGDEGNYADFKDTLEKLHDSGNFEQIQKLKDEYTKKYSSDLDHDFLSKVSDKDKNLYTDLLTPANGDGRQNFYNNLQKYLNESGIAPDGSRLTTQRAIDSYAETLKEYQAQYKKLTPEVQRSLDEYFNTSLEQYKNSKEKLAELAATALITAASLAAVVASGGAATPLVFAYAFAAGGITQNLVAMGIEGSDFDRSAQKIAQNFLKGGVAAAGNFIGGEALGFGKTLATIGDTIAADVAKDVAANALKEGGEDILKSRISQLLAQGSGKISDLDLTTLVDEVATAGTSQAQKQAILHAIQGGLQDQADIISTLSNNSALQNMIRGAVESGVTGGAVNSGSSLANDLIDGRPIDIATLLTTGLTGFAMGSLIHLGISGTTHYLSVTAKEAATAGGEKRLFVTPEKGQIQYVQRGDVVYKIDGDSGHVFQLKDGDIALGDAPVGKSLVEPPIKDKLLLNGSKNGSTSVDYVENPVTKDVVVNKAINYKADGSIDPRSSVMLDHGVYYRVAADGSRANALGTEVSVAADGSITVKGEPWPGFYAFHPSDYQIGTPRYSNTSPGQSIDTMTLRPDGTMDVHFQNNSTATFDAKDRVTQSITNDGVKATFEYPAGQFTSVPNKITYGDNVWTPVNGQWVDANGAPFADNIALLDSFGTLEITNPADTLRLPTKPNEPLESVKIFSGGEIEYRYKNAATATADRVEPPKAPTSKEVLDNNIKSGEVVKQPDGTYVHEDTAANTRTIYDAKGEVVGVRNSKGQDVTFTRDANGELTRVEYARNGKMESVFEKTQVNGRAYWQETDAAGTIVEWHNEVRVDADGSITKLKATLDSQEWTGIKERPDGQLIKVDNVGRESVYAKDLAVEKARVKEFAAKGFGGDAQRQARFEKWIDEFETAALSRKPPLSTEDIANTYYQLDRLISTDNAVLPLADRMKLAEQFIYKTNNPHTIGQGLFNTCNVTAEVENRLIQLHPDKALQMVSDVATTGKFITADGSIIDMTAMNNVLTPFGQVFENDFNPLQYSGRDFFDQLFQTTAVETYWQTQTIDGARATSTVNDIRAGLPFKPGELRYEFSNGPGRSSSGEVINNYHTKPPSRFVIPKSSRVIDPITGLDMSVTEFPTIDTPHLRGEQLLYIDKQILGFEDPPHMIARHVDDSAINVDTSDQLAKELVQMKQNGVFPATVFVDTRDPLFTGLPGDAVDGGAHVISVQNIFERNGKWYVEFTNQWGSVDDHLGANAVPVEALFDAMRYR
ncbi:MAG: hypothetical protein JST89_08180 [Cyanobacteria bacterium SZAS-4]|nr:hypothetical protein [Cyanobacteria bacterium SZAS-4]